MLGWIYRSLAPSDLPYRRLYSIVRESLVKRRLEALERISAGGCSCGGDRGTYEEVVLTGFKEGGDAFSETTS